MQAARATGKGAIGKGTCGLERDYNQRMHLTLQTKLAVFVAAVVILTATLANWTGFQFAKQSLGEQIQKRLSAVAHERQERILAYVNQQKERASLVASRTRLRKQLAEYLAGTLDESAFRAETEKILGDAKESIDEFLSISITNGDGIVVTTTKERLRGKDFSENADYLRGLSEEHLGTPFGNGKDEFVALLTAPASDDDGRRLGVVLIEIQVDGLVKILQDPMGLELSGEVFVATRRDGQFRYLIPTEERQLLQQLPPDEMPAMVKAIDADPGEGVDKFAGLDVLAAWRSVEYQNPEFAKWGMVVTMRSRRSVRPRRRATGYAVGDRGGDGDAERLSFDRLGKAFYLTHLAIG